MQIWTINRKSEWSRFNFESVSFGNVKNCFKVKRPSSRKKVPVGDVIFDKIKRGCGVPNYFIVFSKDEERKFDQIGEMLFYDNEPGLEMLQLILNQLTYRPHNAVYVGEDQPGPIENETNRRLAIEIKKYR